MMEFKPQSRSSLYYDQYLYGIRCNIKDVSLLRELDHDLINDIVEYRNNRVTPPWNRSVISTEQVQYLHEICQLLNNTEEQFKKICYTNHLYIYANSVDLLSSIVNHPAVRHCQAHRVVLDRPTGVVVKQNSPYHHRTFFRERWLELNEISVLYNFLESRLDRYWPSPSMRREIMEHQRRYIRSYYFVDHHDLNDLLMLNLAVPDLIRKTMPIKAK
jgi:hypothetical protein